MSEKRYYGKYRGTVFNILDPMKRARIQATVPAVSPIPLEAWCEPCLPFAGTLMGVYCVPQPEAGVWIEFEQGDPSRPIWTGCFWGSSLEVPLPALAGTPGVSNFVVQTFLDNTLMISDTPGPTGGILLEVGPPPGAASISVSTTGIILRSGTSTISMTPNGAIIITGGAGSVTVGPTMSVTVNTDGLIVT